MVHYYNNDNNMVAAVLETTDRNVTNALLISSQKCYNCTRNMIYQHIAVDFFQQRKPKNKQNLTEVDWTKPSGTKTVQIQNILNHNTAQHKNLILHTTKTNDGPQLAYEHTSYLVHSIADVVG